MLCLYLMSGCSKELPGGDCESIAAQTYDSSSKTWSEVSDDLIAYLMVDENGNPLV